MHVLVLPQKRLGAGGAESAQFRLQGEVVCHITLLRDTGLSLQFSLSLYPPSLFPPPLNFDSLISSYLSLLRSKTFREVGRLSSAFIFDQDC